MLAADEVGIGQEICCLSAPDRNGVAGQPGQMLRHVAQMDA